MLLRRPLGVFCIGQSLAGRYGGLCTHTRGERVLSEHREESICIGEEGKKRGQRGDGCDARAGVGGTLRREGAAAA